MPRLGDYIRLAGQDVTHGQVVGLLLELDYTKTIKVHVSATDEVVYFTLEEFNTLFKVM